MMSAHHVKKESGRITRLDVRKIFRWNNEHPNGYVKRFRNQALDFNDQNMTEQQWVELSINRMVHVYRAMLENLCFCSSYRLREAVERSSKTTSSLLERTRPARNEEPHDIRESIYLTNMQCNLQLLISLKQQDKSHRKYNILRPQRSPRLLPLYH